MNTDLLDKLSILHIKYLNGIECRKEIEETKKKIGKIDMKLFKRFLEANQRIWNLEAQIGNLALEVRKWNSKRAKLKKEKKIFYAK